MKIEKQARVSAFVTVMLATLLCFLPTTLAAARAPEPLAEVEAGASLVTFQPLISHSQVRVTVTGPDGFEVVKTFGADEAAAVELPGADGLYKYELRFSPVLDREARKLLAAARAAGTDLGSDPAADQRMVQRGWFSLAGGSLVPDLVEPEPKVVLTNGDGVIRNSLCVGFDCPDAPVFSDSTILMMENNDRIKFGDTSVGSFPSNDWEIEANSANSGGASYLGFNDCGTADNDGGCATDLVFAVEAGARQSALYVESDGDIGIGTSNPVVDIHVVTGNTPALRLDQDGSSGFAPQTWDVAGNETNFFVRDVTNGSTLPFRIQPGAPSNSIFIAADGDVGIGTASPGTLEDGGDASLHVRRTDGEASILVEEANGTTTERRLLELRNNGAVRFSLVNSNLGSDNEWSFKTNAANTEFQINLNNAGATNELRLQNDGDLIITGTLTTAGAVYPDYVFESDYPLMPLDELASYITENGHLPSVPSASDVDGGKQINMSELQIKLLEKVEELTLYVLDQHGLIRDQQEFIRDQQKAIQELKERLANVEGR